MNAFIWRVCAVAKSKPFVALAFAGAGFVVGVMSGVSF